MKLAIVNLTGGGLSGGAQKYLRKITPYLIQTPGIESIRVFAPPQLQPALSQALAMPVESWPANDGWLCFRELKRKLQRYEPDVVFIPYARWLRCGNAATVVMVRNMEPLVTLPVRNPLRERAKNVIRAIEARRACHRATRVLAVSQFVYDHLTTQWQINPGKLARVYHGIDVAENESRQPAALSGINGDFLFTAGSIRPFRGLEDAVAALIALRQTGRKIVLVIAGQVDSGMEFYKDALQRIAARALCENAIIWTGNLPASELAWCYQHCATFIMTSRTEACPNIALEAMSHKCQIVSTRNPPMPEFFQENALYYDAGDAAGLLRKLVELQSFSNADCERLRCAAQARAGSFTWQECARQTAEQLKLAAESNERH